MVASIISRQSRHDSLDAFGQLHRERMRFLLAVIGKYPDVIIPSLRTIGCQIEIFNRPIDAFERPMSKSRARTPPMGKLVIAEEVEVHDRQPSGDIHFSADGNDLPQGYSDAHSR